MQQSPVRKEGQVLSALLGRSAPATHQGIAGPVTGCALRQAAQVEAEKRAMRDRGLQATEEIHPWR